MLLPAVLAVVLVAGGPALGDPLGDFDGNMHVDPDDIDLIGDAIRLGWTDPMYDITADGETEGQDGVIDLLDQNFLIFELVETTVGQGAAYGDANLDGLIDTTDLTRMALNWGWGSGHGWDDGNFSRELDLVVDFLDFVRLAIWYGSYGHYGPDDPEGPIIPPLPDAIPEPASAALLLLGASAVLRRRRKGRK